MRPLSLYERRVAEPTVSFAALLRGHREGLEPIDAWLPSHNRLSALGVASKHHLADPALAARLLRLDTAHLLHGHEPAGVSPADGPLAGRLFESLVALSIRTFAQG